MKRALTALLAFAGLAVLITGMVFLWTEPRETIFVFAALGAVLGAVVAVTRRNPLYSIVSLLAVFLCLALLYWVLAAELIAVLQLIVSAGAILMLFLFVIMLFNLDSADPAKELGEFDVSDRPGAEEAERAPQGVMLNTPRARALVFAVAVGVLLIVPILMLEDPPEAHLPHWNRFLPLTHEPLTDRLEARLRGQVEREMRRQHLEDLQEQQTRALRADEKVMAELTEQAQQELEAELAQLEDDERQARVQQHVRELVAERAAELAEARLAPRINQVTRQRLRQRLDERAAGVARHIQHKNADERDEIITVALGRHLGGLIHAQEVERPEQLDLDQALVLRTVRQLDQPELSEETREQFAQHLHPRLEAVGVDDELRREIYVELAVRGRLGPHFGSIPGVGTSLIENHVISLEYVGLLILAGCVGVAMLARRRTEEEEEEEPLEAPPAPGAPPTP